MAVDDVYTKSLLHFNTDWTDESGKVWTPSGSPVIDGSIKKFGAGSGSFPGNPAYVSTPGHVDFQFGTSDFTIDFWIKTTTVHDGCPLTNFDPGNIFGNASIYTRINHPSYPNKFFWDVYYDGSGHSIRSTEDVNDNVWNHIELVRYGTNFYMFFNGNKTGIDVVGYNPTINGTLQPLKIARDGSGGLDFIGNLDELRISKGIARDTSNFVPQIKEYGPALINKGLFTFLW